MALSLRVLLLEDRDEDAALVRKELNRANFAPKIARARTEAEYSELLKKQDFDLVLASGDVGQFDGISALHAFETSGQTVPFILLSASVDDELVVESLKHGASDFIVKSRLSRIGRDRKSVV